jgi:hypothetical protein
MELANSPVLELVRANGAVRLITEGIYEGVGVVKAHG